jgi:glycosidase
LNRQSPPLLTDPVPSAGPRVAGKAWWRNAVLYQVYARSFQDSNGDGVGDISGITSRLDYLRWLGVDGLWLTPIYPSPMWDAGYDISDHANVDSALGTITEFDGMIGAARELRLRVLLDLVPNHTSIEHPWFRDHPELVHVVAWRPPEQLACRVRRPCLEQVR